MSKDLQINIVLDCKDMSSIAFVEIEMGGKSIRFGQWIERPDGLNAIRFTEADVKKVAGVLK